MKLKLLISLIMIIFVLVACKKNEEQKQPSTEQKQQTKQKAQVEQKQPSTEQKQQAKQTAQVEQKTQNSMNIDSHKVIVQEVIQATAYTYLRVKEDNKEYWMAIPKSEIKEGDVFYYEKGLETKNFESKNLKRTFETIYFVTVISKEPL